MAEMRTTDGDTVNVKMKDLSGRRCRTTRELSNGWCIIPGGTEMKITGFWRSGVSLTGYACKRCGVKARISQVHRMDIRLIEE